jgi:hypothetical protein
MADREGLKSTASILPKILANFCPYYQRYQSLATVAHTHFTSALGKQIGHVLVAMVVVNPTPVLATASVRIPLSRRTLP